MFRRPPQFVVDPASPFFNDKLGREAHILSLIEMMKDADTPLVMTVSAPWGSGKSSFIAMWKAELERQGAPCILFDAWKHDFSNDPVLSFMGEIDEYINNSRSYKKKNLKKMLSDAAQHLVPILNFSSAAASLFSDPASKILKTSSEAIDITNKLYNMHGETKNLLNKYTNELKNIVCEITSNGSPMYFFIDELDRCEPNYSLLLLERIKHFFDIQGLIFVLCVDREKLGSMVSARYGDKFDTKGYLKRFVDFNYTMPQPNIRKFTEFLAYDYLKIGTSKYFSKENRCNNFIDVFSSCAEALNMRARDIEKVMIKIYPLLILRNEDTAALDKVDENSYVRIYGVKICTKNEYTANDNSYIILLMIIMFIEMNDISIDMFINTFSQYQNNIPKYKRPSSDYYRIFDIMVQTMKSGHDSIPIEKTKIIKDNLGIAGKIALAIGMKEKAKEVISSAISYTESFSDDDINMMDTLPILMQSTVEAKKKSSNGGLFLALGAIGIAVALSKD